MTGKEQERYPNLAKAREEGHIDGSNKPDSAKRQLRDPTQELVVAEEKLKGGIRGINFSYEDELRVERLRVKCLEQKLWELGEAARHLLNATNSVVRQAEAWMRLTAAYDSAFNDQPEETP